MLKKIEKEKQYWNTFYKESKSGHKILPSQFCSLVSTEVDSNTAIAEFGCGNGRDATFFVRNGFKVVAMDLSTEAITINNKMTEDHPNISFVNGDVSNSEHVEQLVIKARKLSESENIAVYSRFFLHSLDDKQEKQFMKSLSLHLNQNDKIYFEFRTNKDYETEKVYKNHFRRFIEFDLYLDRLNSHGFVIEYKIEGLGMAKYKMEDPIVARVIARKI